MIFASMRSGSKWCIVNDYCVYDGMRIRWVLWSWEGLASFDLCAFPVGYCCRRPILRRCRVAGMWASCRRSSLLPLPRDCPTRWWPCILWGLSKYIIYRIFWGVPPRSWSTRTAVPMGCLSWKGPLCSPSPICRLSAERFIWWFPHCFPLPRRCWSGRRGRGGGGIVLSCFWWSWQSL